MNYDATKEGCLLAVVALRSLREQCEAIQKVLPASSEDARTIQGSLDDLAAFLDAAERRLPTTAAVEADRERRKKYRRAPADN